MAESGAKTGISRCNYFTARATQEAVELHFGVAQRPAGSTQQQVQILHSIALSISTARRVKDAMAELFQKQAAASRVRVKTQRTPGKKLN